VPAGFRRQPENIGGQIFIAVLGSLRALRFFLEEPFAFGIRKPEKQLFALFLEGIRNVFQEDEAEADVLALRSIHVPPHLVRGSPELGFKIQPRIVALFLIVCFYHADRRHRKQCHARWKVCSFIQI